MPEMFSPRPTVTRSLAIWMPLCFLWVFMACVSLCPVNDVAGHEVSSALSKITVRGSHESDCCPITEAPTWLIAARQSSTPQASGDVRASSAPSVILQASYAPHSKARLSIQPPGSDPPRGRLGVLRI